MRIADCLNFKIFKDILNLFFLSIFDALPIVFF